MQQIPATGSKYAKLIKGCFQAPKGWLWVGLDYQSLEDHISALVTKDPNKLKVYTDSYDGHCLRAYYYWGSLMPDIELAPPNKKCYKANVGGSYIYFHEDEMIEYKGKHYTGAEIYAMVTNKKL